MALKFDSKGNVVLNPSEGSPNYDVQRPQNEGIISEISDVPLATDEVDMCQAGWVKHITREASLRIKANDNKALVEGDLSAVESFKHYSLNEIYTLTEKDGYKFKELKAKEILIENPHLFNEKKAYGENIRVKVSFILNDTVLGSQVVFTVL